MLDELILGEQRWSDSPARMRTSCLPLNLRLVRWSLRGLRITHAPPIASLTLIPFRTHSRWNRRQRLAPKERFFLHVLQIRQRALRFPGPRARITSTALTW